ncbi:MAG: hypothetical protein ACM33B_02815 [Pseudomonadota bacterium]
MKTVALATALAAAVAAALVVQHRAAVRDAAAYARVASEIARRDVGVHCQGRLAALFDVGGDAGTVAFDADGRPADETRLTRETCSGLRAFARDPGTRRLDCVRRARPCTREAFQLVQAVHTLSHESWHLAGVRDEAETECYALQSTDLVAVRLGADLATARALAVYALERLYPSLPDRYRRGDCVDGGPLDLVPSSGSFP